MRPTFITVAEWQMMLAQGSLVSCFPWTALVAHVVSVHSAPAHSPLRAMLANYWQIPHHPHENPLLSSSHHRHSSGWYKLQVSTLQLHTCTTGIAIPPCFPDHPASAGHLRKHPPPASHPRVGRCFMYSAMRTPSHYHTDLA